MNIDEMLSAKYKSTLPLLSEKQRRLILAADAKYFGRGGTAKVSLASGFSQTTIHTGLKELKDASVNPVKEDLTRSRRTGGGRKKATQIFPDIWNVIKGYLEPYVRGEPESPLLWTSKSTRNISAALKRDDISVSHTVVSDILRENGFSLQANRKTHEGNSHPDRDDQFQYINKKVKAFQKAGQPVISVDAKKKELIGNFKNSGREWHEGGEPIDVNAYDFPSEAEGKAIPYGVYDVTQNKGWVSVGINKDTAEFAVHAIRNWWFSMGIYYNPDATELMITADSGGSNGIHVKLWKREIQKLANEIGMPITICHFPPGTSKWNKIEHRLFSYISKNWRGKPLESYEIVIKLIGSTRTTKGLMVDCQLDTNNYQTGIIVSDKEMEQINMIRKEFHGEWNYTISPND
jgi:hypothetical protein